MGEKILDPEAKAAVIEARAAAIKECIEVTKRIIDERVMRDGKPAKELRILAALRALVD